METPVDDLAALFSPIANQLSISGDKIDDVLTKMKEGKLTINTLSSECLEHNHLYQYGIENLEDAKLILSTAKNLYASPKTYERESSTHDVDRVVKVHQRLKARQGSGSFELNIAENEPPDIRSLSQALVSIYAWENLGVLLGIDMYKLQEIKQACNGDLDMCKNRLYDLWLRQNSNPSWKDIVDALEKMEENNLASKIRRCLPRYIDFDLNSRSSPVRQVSVDLHNSPNASKKLLPSMCSTESDSGQNVNPNLLVLQVPVPVNISLPTTPAAVIPSATARPMASSSNLQAYTDHKLIDLLRSMTIEDPQEIEVNCKVYNAITNKLIQSTKAPLTRDIKLARRPHPRVQEYSSDAVPIGTEIRLEIVTDSACYLYILNIGTSGKATLLLPNEFDPTNYFSADQTYFLPGKDFGFEIEGPAGKETIQMLAFSQKQSSLEKLVDEPIQERELYRDISIRRKKPTPQTEKKGFVQVQFDVN